VRELELELEVGDRPQAAEDHGGVALAGIVDQESLEGVDLDSVRQVDGLAIMAMRSLVENRDSC